MTDPKGSGRPVDDHTLARAIQEGIVFPEGSTIGERFKIVAIVGQGEIGVVYRVEDTTLRNQAKALELIFPSLTKTKQAQDSFAENVRIAQQFNHRNIVRTFDLAEHQGVRFITMEFLDGHNLADVLARWNKLSLGNSLHLGMQVLRGLRHAHPATVHGNLKPWNIFVCNDGDVKLLEFGLARGLGSRLHRESDAASGAAAYLSPEQQSGRNATPQSDLFSVGVVLYRCLTGSLPLGRFELPSVLNRDLPPEIDHVIDSLLKPAPTQRPNSADEVIQLLKAMAKDMGSDKNAPFVFKAPFSGAVTLKVEPLLKAHAITANANLDAGLRGKQPTSEPLLISASGEETRPEEDNPVLVGGTGIKRPHRIKYPVVAIVATLLVAAGIATGVLALRRPMHESPASVATMPTAQDQLESRIAGDRNAIFDYALYSVDRKMWDDAIGEFEKLSVSDEIDEHRAITARANYNLGCLLQLGLGTQGSDLVKARTCYLNVIKEANHVEDSIVAQATFNLALIRAKDGTRSALREASGLFQDASKRGDKTIAERATRNSMLIDQFLRKSSLP